MKLVYTNWRSIAPIWFLLISLSAPCEAQEVLYFHHQLSALYDRYKLGESPAYADARVGYDFEIGVPILTYRLGSFSFLGGLDYNWASVGKESASDVGLNRYGFHAFLFPYRRFNLSLFYDKATTPALLFPGDTRTSFSGFETFVRNRKLPNLRFGFRRSTTTFGDIGQKWNQWNLGGEQAIDDTHYDFRIYRQSYTIDDQGYSNFFGNAYSRTELSDQWRLFLSLGFNRALGAGGLDLGGSLEGHWDRWTSGTRLENVIRTSPFEDPSRFTSLGQFITHTRNRWTAYGSTTFFSNDPLGSEAPTFSGVTITNGGLYRLSKTWYVTGDLSLSSFGEGAPGERATTYHTGVFRGGDVPELVRRSVFFLSDLNFNLRIREEYPPGYIPPELADVLLERRLRHGGAAGLSAEFWHTLFDSGGDQKWGRVSANLQLNSRFSTLLIGDWKKDDDFPLQGLENETRSMLANASYSFGRSTVWGSLSYNWLQRSGIVDPLVPNHISDSGYATGFNSQIWFLPYGFWYQHYDSVFQPITNRFTAFSSFDFKNVGFRAQYDISERLDGLRDNRVYMSFYRFFDTLAFWLGGSS